MQLCDIEKLTGKQATRKEECVEMPMPKRDKRRTYDSREDVGKRRS
jgi:hypothetical protein